MSAALLALAVSTGWGSIDVRVAYHARVPVVIERAAHLRLVAIDVEVEERVAGLFDPRQLAVGDGRAPAMALRLTTKGEPADARDPVFDGDGGHVRLLLVSAQPLAHDEVELAYAGRAIAEVAIEPDGPRIPVGSQRAIAVTGAGRAPLDGHVRLRVLLEAHEWSRMADPRGLALTYSVAGVERRADPDHWIELDDAMRPLARPLAARPLIVPIRRFAIEYWPVEGGRPIALAGAPLPAVPLVLPQAAEAALARAEPDLDAAHYQAE
jgi:hypothetical protein